MDGFLPLKPGAASFSISGIPAPGVAATVIFPPAIGAAGVGGEAVYLFDNTRNNSAAWIGYGATSAAAVANAVVPLLGGSSPAIGVGKGTVQAFTLGAGLFFCAVMEQGSGTVSGIAGYGV